MTRNFDLTFSLFLYAALAAGVVGFSSSPSSPEDGSFGFLALELYWDAVVVLVLLTPALERRGLELAAAARDASSLLPFRLRELVRED